MQNPGLLRRVYAGTDGNAAAEFALVFPLLLLFIFGLIGFGQALWTQATLNYAVQTAARCLQTDTSGTTPCPSGSVAAYIAANAPGLDSTKITYPGPAQTCPANTSPLSVTYPFTFTIPGVSIPMFNMSAQACFPTGS